MLYDCVWLHRKQNKMSKSKGQAGYKLEHIPALFLPACMFVVLVLKYISCSFFCFVFWCQWLIIWIWIVQWHITIGGGGGAKGGTSRGCKIVPSVTNIGSTICHVYPKQRYCVAIQQDQLEVGSIDCGTKRNNYCFLLFWESFNCS